VTQRFGLRARPVAVLLSVVAVVVGAGCGGSVQQAGPSGPWTGARALTAKEDAPSGVATDGTRVYFTTGRTQVGENALRAATLDGDPASTVVAKSPGGRIPNGNLAIDGNNVFIAADSGILRMPTAGGDATTVVDGRPAGVADVVVAGDDLWWTTYQLGDPDRVEVAHAPKSGGPVQVAAVNVSTRLDDPQPDGDTALVGSPKGVLRVRAGSPPEMVVNEKAVGGTVTRLAMDDQRLYVLTTGDHYRLMAIPRDGGAPFVLADDIDSEANIAVVGDQVVFFRLLGSVGSGGHAALFAVPGAGGAERQIATGTNVVGDLAVVGDNRVVFSADDQVWLASVR